MSLSDPSKASRHDPAAFQPRQIRFVSNDGQPHAKRRRINAACQTCRKRKTRCSGERPICKTCSNGGHDCLGYSESGKEHAKHYIEPHQSDATESDSGSPVGEPHSSGAGPKHLQQRKSPRRYLRSPSPDHSSKSESASPSMNRNDPPLAHLQKSDGSEGRSPTSNGTGQSMPNRNRVPYFRYFGPTAIVPGFKQMVVSMKGPRLSSSEQAVSDESPLPSSGGHYPPVFGKTPSASGSETRGVVVDVPFYHANDPGPVPSLIKHLCELFFTHLGCNYPFLQRSRFLRDLEDKRVDAILVDAVCALGARFSNNPLLTTPNEQSVEVDANREVQRAFRGHPFSQRAMSAVIDTFPYPTVAVVQATLLLAYDEFGSNHDSGLWMYLGTSIRMAQDIGMHKLEGHRLEGRVGPTPKTAKRGSAGSIEETEREAMQRDLTRQVEEELDKEFVSLGNPETVTIEDRRANERERIDTFYAVFFLDRVVSSGTGRPVTLRDKDIEISFPYRPDDESIEGWPAPFPPLIRIIHLYGRAADILNGIKEVHQVTSDTLKRLAGMERDLTAIYQGISPKLHFNAINFQHYVKAEQGTNFILLHFWFHTLIVLLHQPTLLHSFGGKIQQLFPDSRELSMSSAKTIADILAFAEFIDAKSFIGNPFTTQPIYIAACAFLAEVAYYSSQPPSGASTPTHGDVEHRSQISEKQMTVSARSKSSKELSTKHTLLSTTANQNYQRCYEALKALEAYWAGTRYILTALDQKSKGIMDPLLYTNEDVESAIEVPRPRPVFSTPGWRRSLGHSHSFSYPDLSQQLRRVSNPSKAEAWSPSNQAIGFSLTGTMNSPNPNLSFLYSSTSHAEPDSSATVHAPRLSPSATLLPGAEESKRLYRDGKQDDKGLPGNMNMLPPPRLPNPQAERISEADFLLGLHSPTTSGSVNSGLSPMPGPQLPPDIPTIHQQAMLDPSSVPGSVNLSVPFGDMMIESQDLDANPFPMGEMLPWLEYLPQDVLSYFDYPQDDQQRPPQDGG